MPGASSETPAQKWADKLNFSCPAQLRGERPERMVETHGAFQLMNALEPLAPVPDVVGGQQSEQAAAPGMGMLQAKEKQAHSCNS